MSLSDKNIEIPNNEGIYDGSMAYPEKDVKEFIKELKEELFTDDISVYEYQNQPNVQKAVEEQISRILKAINKLAGDKLI